MNEIAIIRRSAAEAGPIVEAIRAAFPDTVDVHDWAHVRVERVDSNGQVTAYLAGLPMDELRAVIHLGSPTHGKRDPSREEIYLHQEREQSMLAALSCSRHVKVVNRGFVMAWNRGIFEAPSQLRVLARLGWKTPSVTQSFDLEGEGTTRLRDPDPAPSEQDLLVIGLRRHARAFKGAPHPALDALVARTQLHMREASLDVCTIPFTMTAEGPVAFGLHAGVSTDIGRDELVSILREAVE